MLRSVYIQAFQSTPSGGKATRPGSMTALRRSSFQSTPSGGKATGDLRPAGSGIGVSIHAFRGEGDPPLVLRSVYIQAFQSTPSGGKATHAQQAQPAPCSVSIHAFRGEGDTHHRTARAPCRECFNPRLPGGRRPPRQPECYQSPFVSIHAFRGEGDDSRASKMRTTGIVSIHAFRGEGDTNGLKIAVAALSFNPRLPGGRRPPTSDK